jgi:hypothetical protein
MFLVLFAILFYFGILNFLFIYLFKKRWKEKWWIRGKPPGQKEG